MFDGEAFLEYCGGIENNSLGHLLNAQNNNTVNTHDEPEIIKHSPYYNDLFLKKGNIFNILSLNCKSINAKFDQINIKLQELKNNGYEFSTIYLQETWLSDNSDTSRFMINGYTLISQCKICTTHGGLAIYLCNKYDYNSINIYQNSQVWEGEFIEIIGKQTDKKVILGNIYIDHPGIAMKHV